MKLLTNLIEYTLILIFAYAAYIVYSTNLDIEQLDIDIILLFYGSAFMLGIVQFFKSFIIIEN
jgi:hypothetical protein